MEWVEWAEWECNSVKSMNLKTISLKNNIETIIEKLCGENKRYNLPENFNYQNARTLFNSSNNILNYKSFHTKEVKLTELREFLIKHTKLTSKQINNRFKNTVKFEKRLFKENHII